MKPLARTLPTLLLTALACLLSVCSPSSDFPEQLSRAEQLLPNAPDSALILLNAIPVEELRGKALRARHALLLADAADRADADTDCGPRLEEAWRYYKGRPHELRNKCKTLYFLGRARLRQGDKPGAIREFLKIEEMLRKIDEPYYLGLLYLRIGDVYRNELNFVRAYRYYRDARDLFIRSEDSRRTAEALLGMSASALRLHDVERARRSCAMALELADELQDDTLRKRSLASFATIYTIADTLRIPDELLQRIERTVCNDTSATGLCTRAQTLLFRNRPDSARRCLQAAIARNPEASRLPMLLYTACRVDEQAGLYRQAVQGLRRFLFLNDSLTRMALHTSAGMIEKEYFRERAAFDNYRIRNRRIWELFTAGGILLLLGVAAIVLRQRMRLHKERNERYLALVREAQAEYRELDGALKQKSRTEDRLKGIIAGRFDIVDRLGKTLYERENTASGQAAMIREVKLLIDGFAENGEMLQELEQIVDMAHDNAMLRLRRNFPKMKEADYRLLCYIFGGFSPQVISLFMHDSVANVYARKSRIKARIKASDTPDRELFVSLLE